jgi:hypothetical protein
VTWWKSYKAIASRVGVFIKEGLPTKQRGDANAKPPSSAAFKNPWRYDPPLTDGYQDAGAGKTSRTQKGMEDVMNDKQFLIVLAAIIYSQGKGTPDASVHAAQDMIKKVDEVLKEEEEKEKKEKEKAQPTGRALG